MEIYNAGRKILRPSILLLVELLTKKTASIENRSTHNSKSNDEVLTKRFTYALSSHRIRFFTV